MLCDDIIAWTKNSRLDLPQEIHVAYGVIAEKLRTAQRFVLNREAVLTVHSISESTPKRFLQALGICRLPFPSIWVEFVFADRSLWMEEARKRGMVVESHADASPPSRLGFLMEQQDDNGRLISIIPCWSHPKMNTVSICHMALLINTGDLSVKDDPRSRERVLYGISEAAPKKNKYHRWMTDPAEIEAGVDLESRITENIPEFMKPVWYKIMERSSKADVARLMDLSRYDLKSEWRFVLSLLTVLNSRNVIEIGAESDVSKLNKARAKKGAPLLLTHREIRLNMSKVQKHRIGAGHGSMHDLQAHLVRGHWKLRQSGLYWWNIFVRGSVGKPPVTTTIVRG